MIQNKTNRNSKNKDQMIMDEIKKKSIKNNQFE
jgi:hypothetical protein